MASNAKNQNWKNTFGAYDGPNDRIDNNAQKNSAAAQRTLPNANARERLANDPQLDTFNSSRTDGRPLSTNNGNRGRSASASDNGQMNKLKGYKEVDGGVVPKAADEAVRATRHSAGGNQKPQLIKEEDAAHRDEWGGNGTKSKL